MEPEDLITALRPLLEAEAAAEAYAAGVEAADVEQCVWLRLLERGDPPGTHAPPTGWLRAAVRDEARAARSRTAREVPYDAAGGDPPGPADGSAEAAVLAAERSRALRAAVRRLPGRCPAVLAALLDASDPTYREIAGTLGISQGSLGPVRSHCLAALRRMLTDGDCAR